MKNIFLNFIILALFAGLECKASCPRSALRTNGSFQRKKIYAIGETVNVVCKEGYAVKEDPSSTCLPNGKWDRKLPICRKDVGYHKVVKIKSFDKSTRKFIENTATNNSLTDGNIKTCIEFKAGQDHQVEIHLRQIYSIDTVVIQFESPGTTMVSEIRVTNVTKNDHGKCAFLDKTLPQRVVIPCGNSDVRHSLNGNIVSILLAKTTKPFKICQIQIIPIQRRTVNNVVYNKLTAIKMWANNERKFIQDGSRNTILTDDNVNTCINFQANRDYLIEIDFGKSYPINTVVLEFGSTDVETHSTTRITYTNDGSGEEQLCAITDIKLPSRDIVIPCRNISSVNGESNAERYLTGNKLSIYLLTEMNSFQICNIKVFHSGQMTEKGKSCPPKTVRCFPTKSINLKESKRNLTQIRDTLTSRTLES